MMNRRTMLRGLVGSGLAAGLGPALSSLAMPNIALAGLFVADRGMMWPYVRFTIDADF